MRIAILTEVYPSERAPDVRAFIHARAVLYQRAGHDVGVFSQPVPGVPEGEPFEGVPVCRPATGRLATEVRAFRPDVVAFHTPYPGTPAFGAARDLAISLPMVAWVHGYEAMYTALYGYHGGWRRLASLPWDARKLFRLRGFLRACSGVVYVSQWLRCIAERGLAYRHPNTHVVHNPVDCRLFVPKAEGTDANRRAPLRGIALRGLRGIYGLDLAIQAFAGLERADLTIIGTGPLEDQLRKLIETTGSHTTLIAAAYPHAQVPQLLQQYDFFVAPSRNETQGVAMCEAMACGLPVVATHVGGIPEFVRDGVDGYLVPPENPDIFRAAVRSLTADRQQLVHMGANARARIEQVAGGATIAAQELALLRSVSTGNSQGADLP